jgi:hypothetical protein
MFSLSGCSLFTSDSETTTTSSGPVLPTPQMSVDAVLVDVQFLRIPEERAQEIEQFWQSTDEQVVELQTRKKLESNGIRVGMIPGEMPPIVQQWLMETQKRLSEDTLEQASVASSTSLVPKQLTCRAGKRKELMLHSVQDRWLPVVYQESDSLRGDTFEAPEFIFNLTAIPHGDGRATVRLVPEVKHGQVRNMVIGSEAAFRFDWQRQRRTFDELATQITLSPGQTIVISGTEPARGLGNHYFVAETAQRLKQRVVVLLRVSGTRLDDLFDPEGVSSAERSAQR